MLENTMLENTPGVSEPILEVRGLEVAFETELGPLRAVDGASFALFPGRTLGLVGESGCGKSVSALSILQLVQPPGRIVSGVTLFHGADLMALEERQMEDVRGRQISMIFQDPAAALNPVFSIGDQIAEALRIHTAVSRAEAGDAAVAMLERVGMPDPASHAKSYPHQLSGGMRQRAMIAMALVCGPDVLIADEPTTALDVTIQAQILDLMLEMQREMGLSILFITHDLAVVSEVADDVAVIYAGRVVETSPAKALFERARHPYTKALIETIPGGSPGRLASIPGMAPDPRNLPTGCRFSDRCPLADDQCRVSEPELESAGEAHWAACWKADHD